ncbi:hypothetical protein B0H34DRAFT_687755 [Crassisporium funariophilum]|nr:hypothetical protein B0H34DRAFT_687755 [Crassisporium funariophilum]
MPDIHGLGLNMISVVLQILRYTQELGYILIGAALLFLCIPTYKSKSTFNSPMTALSTGISEFLTRYDSCSSVASLASDESLVIVSQKMVPNFRIQNSFVMVSCGTATIENLNGTKPFIGFDRLKMRGRRTFNLFLERRRRLKNTVHMKKRRIKHANAVFSLQEQRQRRAA